MPVTLFAPLRALAPIATVHWRYVLRAALCALALACGASVFAKLNLQSAAVVDKIASRDAAWCVTSHHVRFKGFGR